jgi:hypothetical protein
MSKKLCRILFHSKSENRGAKEDFAPATPSRRKTIVGGELLIELKVDDDLAEEDGDDENVEKVEQPVSPQVRRLNSEHRPSLRYHSLEYIPIIDEW